MNYKTINTVGTGYSGASAIYEFLQKTDIFYDPLVLPISTGLEEDRKNASETIRAISNINKFYTETISNLHSIYSRCGGGRDSPYTF